MGVLVRSCLGTIVVLFAATGGLHGAHAHEVRFVASYGNNHNLCTREAPCRLLQRGINRTPAGGELIVLDSGDFGDSAEIDQSITISAIGVSAALGGPITVNAADAIVRLRGLQLNGVSAGANVSGITIAAAAEVHIEDCVVEGFSRDGIAASTAAAPQLFIAKTVVRNNGLNGLFFVTGAGARVSVDASRFEGNGGDGLEIRSAESTIMRTIASRNRDHGILQVDGKATIVWTTAEHNDAAGYLLHSTGEMMVESSIGRGNRNGLHLTGGRVRVSNAVLTNNVKGIFQEGGAIFTRGNNVVSGNSTDVSATLNPVAGI